MTQLTLNNLDGDQRDDISTLEYLIQQHGACDDARKALRQILLSQVEGEYSGESIGEALALIAKQPSKNSLVAVVILRCLAVQGLVPEPNTANHIVRSTVELCEASIPEIISFLKIDKRAQNYEKFGILSSFHNKVTEILNPLRGSYGDLDALLIARRDVLGCLNHSIVKIYANFFKLNETRSIIESIYGKLKKVSNLEVSLLVDIEECNRVISSVRTEIKTQNSFLNQEYLDTFLNTCDRILSSFLNDHRGRFATAITCGSGPGGELQKRYPLHEPGREIQVVVPLRNSGPGMATDVHITAVDVSGHVTFNVGTIILGNVLPGDFSVTLDALVISPCTSFEHLLNVEWGEIGSPTRSSEMFELQVVAQSSTVEWASLIYDTPYRTDVAKGDFFIGRIDKVRSIAAKLLRDPMEPFYITGQKRVGKTSLALAATQFAKINTTSGKLDYHYILWGAVAHADPSMSMRQLGESIESFIINSLPSGIDVAKGNYLGSLADLIKLFDVVLRTVPEQKFVIILDEFDEIHQELFLQGNLAETFFGNLRALSRCQNVCIALVGGENMPFIMDRQGQKLNNFSRINLSYFTRETEWSDFQLLVRTPAANILNWHDDAISEVFNSTNGNPYFTQIICAGVFRAAVSERDADITATEVRRSIEVQVSDLGANSFAHLWQDGVPKAADEREPDILRRMRVLVAMARCLRLRQAPTAINIADHKASTSISKTEITAILNDFVRREVLREEDRQYAFCLPIFHLWLVDVGISQLIADALNEELANEALAQENSALVRSAEVVALAQKWPTYKGRHIGTDEIKAWYQQVESFRDQRLLFELLKRTRFFSEVFIRERLRHAHDLMRRSLPEFVIRKRSDRRKDVLLTYIDGEGKSGANYASLYAEENGISHECVMAPGDFRARFISHIKTNGDVAAVVIMDDIAATGASLSANIETFFSDFKDLLQSTTVRVITVVATEPAQGRILRKIDKIDHDDIDFRSCEILPKEASAFPGNASTWESEDDEERAKALCTNIGSKIYNKKSPLGYGNLGLLIVFPTTVPNNSLPILHSYAKTSSGISWMPLFPRDFN